ncbi:CpsD/CapB family tyrosine-protein kinase [Rhodovibrio salinarum]|uniref:non-specific protein-tyrosine kinase n=1 Tax=Rhodovibrio salinarum TaxID=1087 RepID=A0A934QGJ0_9PROT|nr:CpsD/CapB family tyrosine-protein kinase [Rhodovibrio salinarum]MBK1696378.1 hypothetical protein [Rhodovibrio salinarum]
MAADSSPPSRRKSYADQYLGRSSRPHGSETDPYGYWYVERLQRAGTLGDSRTEDRQAPRADRTQTTAERSGAPHAEAAAEHDRDTATFTAADLGDGNTPTAGGPDPTPEVEAQPESARPPFTAPEPRAPAASFAPAVLRQLEQNRTQLSLVEGNLIAAAPSNVSTVYITSCFRGEGKTTAALSTAYGLCAISQARVLLVDAGNQAARLHSMLNVTPSPGLNDVIEGQVGLSDALHPTEGMPGLHVLACGANDRIALSEARHVDRLAAFLAQVKPYYDFIIVDGSATLSSSDPARLASVFDGVVFVVASERTKWEVLQGAVEKVRNGGGQVLGGVLNRRRFYVPRMIYQWISR